MHPRILAGSATLIMAVACGQAEAQQTPTPFGSVVEVTRIITEVRVVDTTGHPVTDLGPSDFEVKLDGRPAEVESVEWIPSISGLTEAPSPPPGIAPTPPPEVAEGRLIVILFQVDFAFHPSRTSGLMQIAPRAAEFVGSLGPRDRVAVLVFRSHLQLRVDFTGDHEAVSKMLTTTEILDRQIDPPEPDGPSLAAHLDAEEARDVASMASTLELIGKALQPIPGPKSLVLFGYALGRWSAGPNITIGDGYKRAMEALTAARTSVFAIDITDADYHSLELGLQVIAEDTGGIYVKTNIFPDVAMARLGRVISSYYELSIIPPPDLDDKFKIKVKVKRPRVEVFARQWRPSD
ncbi:MAG: VWA domain-containing protein [Acidobacteria bacterium]|nr:VWA domain-containing protein [Acidobacteriota bacterium]